MQFDIRAIYTGKSDDIDDIVTMKEECEELVVVVYLPSEAVCTKRKNI